MVQSVKRLVSGNKARFLDPALKLELDLVYLTDQPNIILMGFPASGLAAWYRNDRADVLRFLHSRHGDKYRIYNFVPTWENAYDADYFGGRVSRFPFPDHHAPPLSLISLFVTDIAHWLDGDPDRAAAIHCKAGKGRTGTMAISYLLSLPYLPKGPAPINNLIRSSKKNASKASLDSNASSKHSPVEQPPPPPQISINTSLAGNQLAEDSDPQTPASPLSPATGHSGPPDPEYLFALHTRQRMKPKFSDNTWIPRQLERRTSQVSSLLARSSRSSLQERSRSHTPLNGHASPLAQEVTQGPGLTADAFDAVVQATADASGPRGPLNRFTNNSNADAGPASQHRDAATADADAEDADDLAEQDAGDGATTRKYGVSISSQRRFVGYWFRILHGKDARAPLHPLMRAQEWVGSPVWGSALRGQRRARLVEVVVHREQPEKPTTASKYVDDHIRVELSRYDDALVTRLEEEEWRVRTGPDAILLGPHAKAAAAAKAGGDTQGAVAGGEGAREEAVQRARTFDWGDADAASRYHRFAIFKRSGQQAEEAAAEATPTRALRLTLRDKDRNRTEAGDDEKIGGGTEDDDEKEGGAGLRIDPDRELLVTVFLTKTHTKLPHVASLASVWLVPAFEDLLEEEEEGGRGTRRMRMRFGKGDLDWRKEFSGVVGLDLVWELPLE